MNLRTLLEEVIKSIEIVRNSFSQKRWVKIFLLTPQHYLEDAEHALEGELEARFLADMVTKQVYVFSEQVMHEQAARVLGIQDHEQIRSYIFKAQGKLWSHNTGIKNVPWINKFINFRSPHD
jgi:hypothetical protein